MGLTISTDSLEQAYFLEQQPYTLRVSPSVAGQKKSRVEEQALLQQMWVFVELASFFNVEF